MAEFLFENREELNTRLDFEIQSVDDLEKQVFTYKSRSEAILVSKWMQIYEFDFLNKKYQKY